MSQPTLEDLRVPVEEHFENQGTDVEEELQGEEEITDPWDPNLIRVTSKSFSLRNMMDLVRENDLDLAPEFQRRRVWKPGQKSRLIESVLLQIPLPSFYFSEGFSGRLQVVDGVQRLSTIKEFCQDEPGFRLTGLEYLKEFQGKRFSDLAPHWRRRIHNTQIHVNVIDPGTPDSVKFDIFKRLNTGGTPLTAQEIRHCLSQQTSRDFLARAVALDSFHAATGGALHEHPRMVDREVALRFFAFATLTDRDRSFPEELEQIIGMLTKAKTMDAFLTEVTRRLDQADQSEHEWLLAQFDRAMSNAHKLFGEHAFRKWSTDEEKRNPINRALFESWSVVLARYSWDELAPMRSQIVLAAREHMTSDEEYLSSISVSTGDPRRVVTRFQRAEDIVRSALL